MPRASTSLYHLQSVPTATPAACGTGKARLMALVLVAAGADATLEVKNGLTDTGDVLLTLACKAGTTCGVDLTVVGGITFSTGLFVKPAGTGAVAHAWYE